MTASATALTEYAWAEPLRGLERIRATDVPGLVLCQYQPSGKNPRCYVITHEPSGIALTQRGGDVAGIRYLKVANNVVRTFAELRYRRRPIQWDGPVDVLKAISAVTRHLEVVNGWIVLTDRKRSVKEQFAEIDAFRRKVGWLGQETRRDE